MSFLYFVSFILPHCRGNIHAIIHTLLSMLFGKIQIVLHFI